MRNIPTVLAAAASLAALTWAAEAVGPVVLAARAIEWKASGSLPPGAEYHLIYEDPATHAVQTLVRMPKGYVLPAHSHSQDETILVLRGKLLLEFGARKETVSVGGYAVIPRGTVFTLRSAGFGGAEFLAAFSGPFDMKSAEPAKP
ncbi:MAG: cupin domain-containing protein [Elusimicrobiota bacterium]